MHGANLGISFSCFTGNSALVRGIVFVDQSSSANASIARNSFGIDNEVRLSDCTSVFVETEGSCLSTSDCQGRCEAFGSRSCRIAPLTGDGTLNPTVAPSPPQPGGTPTGDGGGGGGGGPDNGDDGGGFVGSIAFILIMVLVPFGCCLLVAAGFLWLRRRNASKTAEVQPLVDPDKEKGYEDTGELLGNSWSHFKDRDGDEDDDDSLSSNSTDHSSSKDVIDPYDDDDDDDDEDDDDDVVADHRDSDRDNQRGGSTDDDDSDY